MFRGIAQVSISTSTYINHPDRYITDVATITIDGFRHWREGPNRWIFCSICSLNLKLGLCGSRLNPILLGSERWESWCRWDMSFNNAPLVSDVYKVRACWVYAAAEAFCQLSRCRRTVTLYIYAHYSRVEGYMNVWDIDNRVLWAFITTSFNVSTIRSFDEMPDFYAVLLFIAISLVTVIVQSIVKHKGTNPDGLPLPPGPKPFPLLGNLRDLPKERAWLTYKDWQETYGQKFRRC